jgi:Ca2+/Na+ antiporter
MEEPVVPINTLVFAQPLRMHSKRPRQLKMLGLWCLGGLAAIAILSYSLFSEAIERNLFSIFQRTQNQTLRKLQEEEASETSWWDKSENLKLVAIIGGCFFAAVVGILLYCCITG